MIEKILNNFGYIKVSPLQDIDFHAKAEELLFKDLAGVDGFHDYLNSMMAKDMKRYFVAETEAQQNLIKGGYSRMMYFKARLEKKEITK